MKFGHLTTILFFTALPWQLMGQTTHQQAYWARLYLRGKLQGQWSWHLEMDERRLICPDRQLQFITHAHVHRKIGRHWEVAAGTSYSNVQGTPEWRLFLELHAGSDPSRKWSVSGRLRSEQRWFGPSENSWQLKHRFRARLQASYNILKKWRAKFSDEIMVQAGEFDQNRAYAAIERYFPKKASLELGYLKIFQKRAAASYFDRDVLRCTLYLNLYTSRR